MASITFGIGSMIVRKACNPVITHQLADLVCCLGTWHPLGRVTGGTLYPGLMVTSGVIYHLLRFLTLPVDIRNICVLLAPGFSGLTAFATYLFTSEMSTSPSAGLLAAIFMGITPGYISRSVAGSYDNEAIAIFLLVFVFYLWIKAVKQGSIMWAGVCALFYGYMVSAWGGYVFITNLLPLHAFVLICMGRFSPRLYVSYTTWYALGTLASMQVPFVGFLPIRSSDHMAALGTFCVTSLLTVITDLVSRRVWSRPIGWLHRVHPLPASIETIPNLASWTGIGSLRPGIRLPRPTHRVRDDCAMVWPLLLTLGYCLRQGPYSNHCFGVRASANSMASVLLRPEHADLALPSRRVSMLPESERRASVHRHLLRPCQLLCRRNGAFDADTDTHCLRGSCYGAQSDLGHILSSRDTP